MPKLCAKCGSVKANSEFHFRNKERTKLCSYCKPCASRHTLDWMATVRADPKRAPEFNETRKLNAARSNRSRVLRGLRPSAAKRKAWGLRNRIRIIAGSRLHTAIKSGRIKVPTICSECGQSCKPEGHHEDYSKPLEVTWLCRACHLARHGKRNRTSK